MTEFAASLQFFLEPDVAPFAAVMLVLSALALFELVLAVLFGVGLSQVVNLVDTDGWPEVPLVNWFVVQGVPFMLILSAFLLGFGVTGVGLQALVSSFMDATLDKAYAYPVAAFGGLMAIRVMGQVFRGLKVQPLPAISYKDFLGRTATLTSNRASHNAAGEAVFHDEHGTRHSVMVRPLDTTLLLFEGDKVVLQSRQEDGFFDARRA